MSTSSPHGRPAVDAAACPFTGAAAPAGVLSRRSMFGGAAAAIAGAWLLADAGTAAAAPAPAGPAAAPTPGPAPVGAGAGMGADGSPLPLGVAGSMLWAVCHGHGSGSIVVRIIGYR